MRHSTPVDPGDGANRIRQLFHGTTWKDDSVNLGTHDGGGALRRYHTDLGERMLFESARLFRDTVPLGGHREDVDLIESRDED